MIILSGCGAFRALEKKITKEYDFTGDNLQIVVLSVEYYYVPLKKRDDIDIYLNGYKLSELSSTEHIKTYYLALDPGKYTLDISKNGVWTSSDFEVKDNSDVDIFVEQYINYQYKINFFSSVAELEQVVKLSDTADEDKIYCVDLPGNQDDELWGIQSSDEE